MSGTPRLASPGTPPLLWSSVEEAFRNINQNFNELYATIQADGSTQVVNFSQLYDDVSPAVHSTYSLGDIDTAWKNLYLSPWSTLPGNESNGLWLGNAQIKDEDISVVLPVGSKVGSDLIIDTAKTFWKTFNIDSGNSVEAAEFADTLNINSGTAMQIVVDSSAESLTFNNIGVISLIAGTGTSVSSATGNVTVTNTGVISLTNVSSLPSGLSAGSGISVSTSTGNIAITNTGVLDVQNGFGITVSRDDATGIVTVTNNAPAQVAFRTISVAGSSDLVADSTADTLVVAAGYGMVITTSEVGNDTLVLAVDQNIDITGSVFANDSSIIVDSIDQRVFAAGGFTGNLTGDTAGYHTGDVKGSVFGDDSTKIVDAVENKVFAEFFGNITGNVTGTVSGNVTGNAAGDHTGTFTGNVFTTLIDSADSSAITVTPAAVFSSDVTVENELFIGSSRVIAVDEIKTIVAASTDFADFQARIAAL